MPDRSRSRRVSGGGRTDRERRGGELADRHRDERDAPRRLVPPGVKIDGKITASSHRFAYRQCRIERRIHIQTVRISGAIGEEGDTYPTTKSGHFDYGQTNVEYGGTDSTGRFYDHQVPWSGGTATFILSTGRISVARDRLGIRSYSCRPLSLTLQVAIPPDPLGPP